MQTKEDVQGREVAEFLICNPEVIGEWGLRLLRRPHPCRSNPRGTDPEESWRTLACPLESGADAVMVCCVLCAVQRSFQSCSPLLVGSAFDFRSERKGFLASPVS